MVSAACQLLGNKVSAAGMARNLAYNLVHTAGCTVFSLEDRDLLGVFQEDPIMARMTFLVVFRVKQALFPARLLSRVSYFITPLPF